jgi:type I restriction enzyme M protein
VPVYSSSKNEHSLLGLISLDFLKKNNLIVESEPSISFNLDGSVGYCFIRKDKIYSFIDVVAALKILTPKISLDYIKIQLENEITRVDVSYATKFYFNKFSEYDIRFSIPILSNGDFDIEHQQEIVEKYNLIAELKAKIGEHEKDLADLTILINNEMTLCKNVKVGDIFKTVKGLSKYTKTYGQSNNGNYPVYSASNNAPLTLINSFDYEGKYLTWATNGFAGYIKIIDGQFSINGDRGLLIPKYDGINIDYIKVVLEPILRELAKGRKGDNGENEFTKVYPSMVESVSLSIPILSDGKFDISRQNETAASYRKIEEVKNLLLLELKKIQDISIKL